MELEGRVIQFLGETGGTSKAGNPWKKKEWVVETFGQYPRKVKVQCFGERSDNINLEPGKDYTLSIDIESREYNGRWYTDVSVFRVQDYVGATNAGTSQGFQTPTMNQPTSFGGNSSFASEPYPFTPTEDSEEDLPF